MNTQEKCIILLLLLISFSTSFSQQNKTLDAQNSLVDLFESEEILPIKLAYSMKEIRTKTNDSTYIKTDLFYRLDDGEWRSLEVKLRGRGNNRRKTCFFTPIKVKISKTERKGTPFEAHKKLKLVLPCLIQAENDDKLLREYLAYKLYEEVGTYYYKTRLLDIDYTDIRGKRNKSFQLKGFFQEDIDKIAKRAGGKELKNRKVHPLQQDDHASIQNDILQYMIGNTDFSNAYQHNTKLIFTSEKKTVPIPYDFDLSGLVNASYAVVSEVGNQSLPITHVTERLYRGYKRNVQLLKQVRQEYLGRQGQMMAEVDNLKPLFENIREYQEARDYLSSFFIILANQEKFKKEIENRARTK
ncbi:MAG: hypothetical protein ABF293_01165 [Flavobacteriaceae bacterium]